MIRIVLCLQVFALLMQCEESGLESLSPNEVHFNKRIDQEKLNKILELYDDVSPDTWNSKNVIPDYKCSIPFDTSSGSSICMPEGNSFYCSHPDANQPTSTCIKRAPNNLIADLNIWKVPAQCSPIFEHDHPSKGWYYYKGCAVINGNKRPPQCSSHISSKEGQLMDCIDKRNRRRIDGKWSEWNKWSQCEMSCGEEFQKRSRSCTDPIPQFGGKVCLGDDNQSKSCNNTKCLDAKTVKNLRKISTQKGNSKIKFRIFVSISAMLGIAAVITAAIYITEERSRLNLDLPDERSILYEESGKD